MCNDPNPTAQRDIEIQKLVEITTIIFEMLPAAKRTALVDNIKAGNIDIDLSDEAAGILMTVFTCLRKEQGHQEGHLKYKGYSATLHGETIQIADVLEKVKNKGIILDFMVATPIVELMTLFKAFFDEVRTGVTKFKVRSSVLKRAVKRSSTGQVMGRQDIKESTQNITQYGLTNQHIPLLQGITLAPERRTGVVRSLGPLAQCILLIMEDKYFDKLMSTVNQSLMMLPMASEIATCLKESNTPGRAAGVLKELGDILLITITARATQKIYFPLFTILYMWHHKPQGFQWSFSGAEMIKHYSDLVDDKKLTYTMKSGGTVNMTGEAIFHATFGTYMDDLEILESITTKATSWSNRRDMNNVFVQRSTKPQIKPTMIGFKLVAKMAQAMLTKSLGNVEPCFTSRPSFTGFRKRTFTQEFLTYLTTGKGAQSYSSDPNQLQYALKKVKDQILEDIHNVKILKAGTTKWQKKTMETWEECDDVPVEGTRKFFLCVVIN